MDLVQRLSRYLDVAIEAELIENIFSEYDWEQMGYNSSKTKLIYIESPMGREIDLHIEMINDYKLFIIREIETLYWD